MNGGTVPGGKGILGGAPFVPGVWEMSLIGERGTGEGGLCTCTIPAGIVYPQCFAWR